MVQIVALWPRLMSLPSTRLCSVITKSMTRRPGGLGQHALLLSQILSASTIWLARQYIIT
jgi:hypothetical protein